MYRTVHGAAAFSLRQFEDLGVIMRLERGKHSEAKFTAKASLNQAALEGFNKR